MVKVRGRNSNGKTVKQTAENWHVRAFVTSWCHTGATSQSWQGHVTESRYSWSAGINPRQVMTWYANKLCWQWHDDDCDRHLAHHREAVQSRDHDASNLDPMAQEIFVTFWYLYFFLWASCRQVSIVDCSCVFSSIKAEVDCEDHVVPPVKFLEPYDSNQSAASLTLHENDRRCSCAVYFWHIVVKPRRRKTTRTYYRIWKSRWNNELRCIGFGGFAIVRRYLLTRNLRITSNFFRCTSTMYLVSPSVLCHCLVKQHSPNDKKKKKKDCQMSVYHKADPELSWDVINFSSFMVFCLVVCFGVYLFVTIFLCSIFVSQSFVAALP